MIFSRVLYRQCCKIDLKKINYSMNEFHDQLYNDYLKLIIENNNLKKLLKSKHLTILKEIKDKLNI